MERPLLIGVVRVPPRYSPEAIRQLRQRLALYCNAEGLGLLEILELRGQAAADLAMFDYLAELGARMDIQAILIHGPLEDAKVERLADRMRARLLRLPITFQPGLAVRANHRPV